MDRKFEQIDALPEGIVYVREVDVTDLPPEVAREAGGHQRLYALHNPSGERLALVADRKMAFVLARQNNLNPVAVH